ncbi:MAG: hypothetical protein KGL39_59620 [Patescibacteria group bacterium]|nr:hypothetical protein [Patescibacteria group bacterium]
MAKHPEFKRPEGVHVKQPEPEAGLFDDEPAPPTIEASKIEWLDIPIVVMDDKHLYPLNGQPVWLTPDGTTEYLAVWRTTRELRNGRFQPVGFWAVHNGGGVKIDFEPLGYRRYDPPVYVPKKRA